MARYTTGSQGAEAVAEGVMATITVDVTEDDARDLAEAATRRGVTPEALVRRWVQERLVHERERAVGGGKAMSPRARREQEKGR